jgi:hypothetical protein
MVVSRSGDGEIEDHGESEPSATLRIHHREQSGSRVASDVHVRDAYRYGPRTVAEYVLLKLTRLLPGQRMCDDPSSDSRWTASLDAGRRPDPTGVLKDEGRRS